MMCHMAQKASSAISASAERVFKILKRHFTQYENSALQSMYVEVGMLPEFSNSYKPSLLL